MIITIYRCDRCAQEEPTKEDMTEINITQGYYKNTIRRGLFCSECLESMGLRIPEIQTSQDEQISQIEGVIRNICREEIEEHNS